VAGVGFPFGRARDVATFPFGAAQGLISGGVAGFGFSGWAIAFVVLFFVAIVLWNVWRAVGPWIGGFGALGFF
jgi:hypothetical protein